MLVLVAALALGARLAARHRAPASAGRAEPGSAAAPSAGGAPAGSSAAGSGSGPAAATPSWRTLPALGRGDSVAALGADPDGTLWLAEAEPGGGLQLFHATAAGADGGWALGAEAAGGGAVRIQTIGTDQVWIALGPQELSFDKAAHTVTAHAGTPALAAASVAGYSVGLYAPGAGAPPHVLVAALGAAQARRVDLPGAAPNGAAPNGTVLAGSGGMALVLVGTSVWSVDPHSGRAALWGRLPQGALAGQAAWGEGRLWFPVAASAPEAESIDSLAADGSLAGVAAAGPHPPAADAALAFSGDLLWWASSTAIVAYDPASGAVTAYPLPAAGGALVAAAPASGAWAAVGDAFALLPGA